MARTIAGLGLAAAIWTGVADTAGSAEQTQACPAIHEYHKSSHVYHVAIHEYHDPFTVAQAAAADERSPGVVS